MPHLPSSSAVSPVARPDLERCLAWVAQQAPDAHAGIYNAASLGWKVHRESALFLGAGRAALLQLAHPWVAAAIAEHSHTLEDPIGRFHGTFRVVFSMIFGHREQAFTAARWLHTLHTRIRGELPAGVAGWRRGTRYQANEISALVWVFATLIESAMLAYDFALPSLTLAEKQTYYAESKRFAALFGIPPEALPPDWSAFLRYTDAMCASSELGVSQPARRMGNRVLAGAGSWVRPPRWYRDLTASWLPERLRREFGLPFGAPEEARVRRAQRWFPQVYQRLPTAVRFVGPYHEAQARLRGAKAPGRITQWSNRFWMGQPRMIAAASAAERRPPTRIA